MRAPKGRFERVILKGALWVGIALLLGLGVFLAGATWDVYQKEQNAARELDAALTAQKNLEEREKNLSEDLASLASERGMEAEFRERFPVAKSGEEVIVLVDQKSPAPDTGTASSKGFWGTLKGWFGF